MLTGFYPGDDALATLGGRLVLDVDRLAPVHDFERVARSDGTGNLLHVAEVRGEHEVAVQVPVSLVDAHDPVDAGSRTVRILKELIKY